MTDRKYLIEGEIIKLVTKPIKKTITLYEAYAVLPDGTERALDCEHHEEAVAMVLGMLVLDERCSEFGVTAVAVQPPTPPAEQEDEGNG